MKRRDYESGRPVRLSLTQVRTTMASNRCKATNATASWAWQRYTLVSATKLHFPTCYSPCWISSTLFTTVSRFSKRPYVLLGDCYFLTNTFQPGILLKQPKIGEFIYNWNSAIVERRINFNVRRSNLKTRSLLSFFWENLSSFSSAITLETSYRKRLIKT